MKKVRSLIFMMAAAVAFTMPQVSAQTDLGNITGSFQMDAQYYNTDSIIGAPDVPEKMLSNSYLILNYNVGNFSAGVRYENYANPILGIDSRFKGNGIAYKFAEYKGELFEVTAGNFYEQFGSGMILRAYEERALGFDNSLDGVRFRINPIDGVTLTGLWGKQRFFWALGNGIIRGGDLKVSVNELLNINPDHPLNYHLGFSAVSKYEADNSSMYGLPENNMAISSRASVYGPNFNLDAEYAYRSQDPCAANKYHYNPGYGLLLTGSYFQKGLGISLNYHSIDNMDMHSERAVKGNALNMNYLPPLTRQHAYRLATMYPYSTQLFGETGIQAEVTYTIPRKTMMGGRYGTTVNVNYSYVTSLDTTGTYFGDDGHVFEYDSDFLAFGSSQYYRDFNIEIQRKIDKQLKLSLSYISLVYDKDRMEHEGSPHYGKVNANIAVADITYKITSDVALRVEFQHMWSEQDSVLHEPDNVNGNWAYGLAELTFAPAWFISVWDEYNYGNEYEDYQLHYVGCMVAYVHETTRIALGYGRQRGGILCVGGVCRPVPASNGFNLSITTSF